jgi:Ni/Fe-hydrogenase subunit HybB-like protein
VIDRFVTAITFVAPARPYFRQREGRVAPDEIREMTMQFTVEKSVFRAVAVIAATGAVVAAMQVHLWQARASAPQAVAEATMSSFIHDLHFNGYSQHLPILVVKDPI